MNFRPLVLKLGPTICKAHLLVTEPKDSSGLFAVDSLPDSIRLAKLGLLSIGPIL